jgi:hypothetical protein
MIYATCHPEAQHYAKGLCRQCYRTQPKFLDMRKAYYQANREQWRVMNARVRAERRREAARYGISAADQEAMLEAQGHVCALCRRPPGKKRLSVDHDHVTGRVRGMLCGACNTALGGLQDSPEMCERAAEYLRRHSVSPKASAA